MSTKRENDMDARAARAEEMLETLEDQMEDDTIYDTLSELKATLKDLRKENSCLKKQVLSLVGDLDLVARINKEKGEQIPVKPHSTQANVIASHRSKLVSSAGAEGREEKKKTTKAKETQATKDPVDKTGGDKIEKPTESQEQSVDIGRLDLRVGKIISVKKHPDADSLYVEAIDLGEEKPRTVVSGLVKHIPMEQLQNVLVVVLCNLKPVKMRGILSEGMVMCASTLEKVEILIPPCTSVPGDKVVVAGYTRNPDDVLNPKKKVFETVAVDLKTNEACIATYKGIPLFVPGKGEISTSSLKSVFIK